MPKRRPPTGFYKSAPAEFVALRRYLYDDLEPFETEQAMANFFVCKIKPVDRPVVKRFLNEMIARNLPEGDFHLLWNELSDITYFTGDMRRFTRMMRDTLPDE